MRAAIVDTHYAEAKNDEHFCLSAHAEKRMSERAIDLCQVQQAISYGRIIHSRRARFYVIGKKELACLHHQGVEASHLENIQVVVDERSNTILTVYRNRDFRQIRPVHRHERKLQ